MRRLIHFFVAIILCQVSLAQTPTMQQKRHYTRKVWGFIYNFKFRTYLFLQMYLIMSFGFSSLCFGYKNRFIVDTIDLKTNKHVRIAAYKIGKKENYKYGKLVIEKSGDKYYITIPFFMYTPAPDDIKPNGEGIPKGTSIYLRLNDGEVVQTKTDKYINYFIHYLWRFPIYAAITDGIEQNGGYEDFHGTVWHVRVEFTPSNMSLLSNHGIENIYLKKENVVKNSW